MSTESMFAEKETKSSNLRFHVSELKKGVQNKTADRFEPLGYLYENETKSGAAVIQAKLLYGDSEVTKDALEDTLAELEEQGDLGLSDPKLRKAVMNRLTGFIFDKKNTYELDTSLIERIKKDAQAQAENIIARQQREAEAQALEQHRKSQAQKLFEYLKGQEMQELSADELKPIFEAYGFEVKQEISVRSTVLGTIVVTAFAGDREYLYVEIHPKGGIHYSSYVLIGLYGRNKEVIERHKVVMSKSARYLGKNEEETTTTFGFLKPESGFSDMKSGRYPHRSRYFPAQPQEARSGELSADEREAFLMQKSGELFATKPIDMAKGKQMKERGFWDEILYVSVQKMKAAKEWALRLERERAERAEGDPGAMADLLLEIRKLDLELYDLRMDDLEDEYRLEKIRHELEMIEHELMIMESGDLLSDK